jgi:hypothetical protein
MVTENRHRALPRQTGHHGLVLRSAPPRSPPVCPTWPSRSPGSRVARVGSTAAAGRANLHDVRHTAGNVMTLVMEILAVTLVLALTHTAAVRTCPRGW